MVKYQTYIQNDPKDLQLQFLEGGETYLWETWGIRNMLLRNPYNALYYLQRGQFHFDYAGGSFEAYPGQMVLLPGHQPHAYHAYGSTEAKKIWMHFSAPYGKTDLFQLVKKPLAIDVDNHAFVTRTMHSILKAAGKDDMRSIMDTKACMFQLLSYFLDKANIESNHLANPQTDEKMERLTQYIKEHIDEEIQIRDLAKLVHLNPNYLIHYFQNKTNMTPIQYIRTARINLAKRLLEDPTLSVTDIATKCGFSSVYYFDRVFKEHTNVTPSDYRRVFVNGNQSPLPRH